MRSDLLCSKSEADNLVISREQPRGRLGRLSRFFRRNFATGGPAGEVSVAGFRSR